MRSIKLLVKKDHAQYFLIYVKEMSGAEYHPIGLVCSERRDLCRYDTCHHDLGLQRTSQVGGRVKVELEE